MTQVHSIRRALFSWAQQHLIFSIPLNMELTNDCPSTQRELDLVQITHSMEIVHEMLRLHRTTMPPIFYLPKLTRRLARDAFIGEDEAGWPSTHGQWL